MEKPTPIQESLIREVLEQDRCSACGACVGLCPYFTFFQGRVVAPDRCSLTEGRCGQFCPHLVPNDALRQETPGRILEEGICRAQDPGIRKKGQYGGSTTALILLALELGRINGAVLTGTRKSGEPEGRVCRTRAEVLECVGSKYSGAGTLSVLPALFEVNEGPLALVGTPCQITAARNIRAYREKEGRPGGMIYYTLGLFCTWSVPYPRLQTLLREKGIADPVLKYDIPPPPAEEFLIQTRKKRYRIPLREVRPLVPRGCLACGDMTGESADLAVGSAEGVPGWNTILVRTERGQDLVREARDRNMLEVKPLPKKNRDHLWQAVSGKKKKAAAELERMGV